MIGNFITKLSNILIQGARQLTEVVGATVRAIGAGITGSISQIRSYRK